MRKQKIINEIAALVAKKLNNLSEGSSDVVRYSIDNAPSQKGTILGQTLSSILADYLQDWDGESEHPEIMRELDLLSKIKPFRQYTASDVGRMSEYLAAAVIYYAYYLDYFNLESRVRRPYPDDVNYFVHSVSVDFFEDLATQISNPEVVSPHFEDIDFDSAASEVASSLRQLQRQYPLPY